MSDFKPIDTQEAFDAAIKDRIARAEKTAEARVRAELQEELNKVTSLEEQVAQLTGKNSAAEQSAKETADKISGLETQLAEALAKNKGFELDALKLKVATEKGLPLDSIGLLNGETEDVITANADKLSQLIKAQNYQGLPMANLEPGAGDYATTGKINEERAMKQFMQALEGINE